jgi:non-canonical purine NTP pyrophosphatase (RdgB/HAM1 family)
VINHVLSSSSEAKPTKYLEIATRNQHKLAEFKRFLPDYEIIAKDLNVPEIQSLDPIKVASEKAKLAYQSNGYNPILIEDTSLDIKGLDGLPGTYVNDFFSETSMRRQIVTEWLKDKDRTAVARVTLAIFDGKEVFVWEGKVEGQIAEELRGANGFGWDDIFIPDGQSKKEAKTFAEMSDKEKDSYSMRTKALEKFIKNPPELGYPVFMLPEPYPQELQRVRLDKLQDAKAIEFAYKLECLEDSNKISKKYEAPNYSPVLHSENIFFSRFLQKQNSHSVGLMFTDVDRNKLKLRENGYPILWQMGPERRFLSLVQRAEFFSDHQNPEIHKILDDLEKNKDKFPKRNNRRSITLEKALGIEGYSSVTRAISLKELGYKKLSSDIEVSRTQSAKYGLYTMVGKYARSMYAVGCLPFISGWRDVIVTSALAHIPVFVHRNNMNAIDFRNQVELIKSARDTIISLKLGTKVTKRALNNIGAALGCNPKVDLEKARVLYNEAGVKLFRIYTINSDPRVVETARALRAEFGDEIEIFVGQVIDKRQCQALIADDIRADGLVFGHGGGRQCTSATNGMALATLEEIYEILIDKQFNDTSIVIEGGIGTSVGALMIMGVDCILRNAQFANCVIEQGDVYFEHINGKFCQPYHGSASAATMIIESYNPENAASRLEYSGRTRNVEGKAGYVFYKERANSVSFYVNEFKGYAARTLADLGVKTIWEMREFLEKNNQELLRLVSMDAAVTSTAYGS